MATTSTTGRNLLITGGTGSFGNAFTERVLNDNFFDRIVIFSRDEKKQQEMRRRFNDSRLRFFLGDVRDRERLTRAFCGVDYVVHAAALKQVDRSGEAFDEFVKTNALGSLNVVRAAHLAGVQKVVGLSTDKACAPSTPYGVSKATMEWLFVGGSAWGDCRFCCTRYGNIINSRGGVMEIWQNQVNAGQKITITDPTMTRFWMTLEQSVNLVLLALDRMRGGEIFVPKDIKRGSIDELVTSYFPDHPSYVIGKRSYEKQHERLIAREEADRVRDCGDVYVIQPLHVRWAPEPYGADMPSVPDGFEYRSDKCT